MEDYTIRFGQNVVSMPWWWVHALMIWLGLLGLILFLFGQRLVRPTFAVLGIVIGALAAAALTQRYAPSAPVLPIAAAAALALGVVFLLLWRIGMAVVFGAFSTAVLAAVVLATLGKASPAIDGPILATFEKAGTAVAEATEDGEMEGAETAESAVEIGAIVHEGWVETRAVIDAWWGELEPGVRWLIAATAVGGGLLCAILALALPWFGASIVTAFIGTLLALPGVVKIMSMLSEGAGERIVQRPRDLVLSVAVATVIGAAIQWMLRPRRADK